MRKSSLKVRQKQPFCRHRRRWLECFVEIKREKQIIFTKPETIWCIKFRFLFLKIKSGRIPCKIGMRPLFGFKPNLKDTLRYPPNRLAIRQEAGWRPLWIYRGPADKISICEMYPVRRVERSAFCAQEGRCLL